MAENKLLKRIRRDVVDGKASQDVQQLVLMIDRLQEPRCDWDCDACRDDDVDLSDDDES